MNRIDIERAADFLQNAGDSYILIHRAPDGDCVGAGYSLAAAMRRTGRRARVLCADPIPERFHFLRPEGEDGDFSPECIISVDVADERLLGSLEERYRGRVDLCIDHHVSNCLYAKEVLLDPDAAATCEVLFRVYRAMGLPLTRQMAMCLYTGIATDTGCFKFSNTSARTHFFAGEIMNAYPDIRYDLINREMFTVKSRGRLAAEMELLQGMEYLFDGKCTLLWMTKELCRRNGVDEKDMEGMTSLGLQPEGVEIAVTVRERGAGEYKISARSATYADVSALCARFGGGGHVHAAGCQMKGTPEDIRERLLAAMEDAL